MWKLNYKESWAQKNWCFWTVVLEKTLDRPLNWKEVQPVYPKGDQSWVFIGRIDAEAETSILDHLIWRVDSFEKTLMLGGIGGRRRRGQLFTWGGQSIGHLIQRADSTFRATKKYQFSSVQSLGHVQLFATPWIPACQASLSINNSQSLSKFMSIE